MTAGQATDGTHRSAHSTPKERSLIPIRLLLTHYIIIKPKSYYNIKYGFACLDTTKIEENRPTDNTLIW